MNQFTFFKGRKSFVICSQHTNLLVVVAQKSAELRLESDEMEEEIDEDSSDSYITFIVDPKSSGITVSEENRTIGCSNVPYATVNFSNVHVGKDQILSESLDDRKISDKLMDSSRLQSATLNMVLAKNILQHLIEFTISVKCNSEKLR